MLKTKFIVSFIIFTTFLIITSAIKNKTRVIEKQISDLNLKVLMKKKDINETQLDFFYLTSPSEIEKKLDIIGFDRYLPIKYSNIFLQIYKKKNRDHQDIYPKISLSRQLYLRNIKIKYYYHQKMKLIKIEDLDLQSLDLLLEVKTNLNIR